MTPNGGATNPLLIFVREYGTTVFKDVVLQTKTELAFDGQVKSLFGVGAYTVTVLDNMPSLFPSISDQEIATLNNGANLEVKFANKFYWIPTEEQILGWIKQFKSVVDSGSNILSGDQARNLFLMHPRNTQAWMHDLFTIWALADRDMDNSLSLIEFCIASFLIYAREQNQNIPQTLPKMIVDIISKVIKSQKKSTSKFERSSSKEKVKPDKDSNIITPFDIKYKERRNSSKRDSLIAMSKTDNSSSYWQINPRNINVYKQMFINNRKFINGNYYLIPSAAPSFFSKSGLDTLTLGKIWNLSNFDSNSNGLSDVGFILAMHVVSNTMKGKTLPLSAPEDVKIKIAQICSTIKSSSRDMLTQLIPRASMSQPSESFKINPYLGAATSAPSVARTGRKTDQDSPSSISIVSPDRSHPKTHSSHSEPKIITNIIQPSPFKQVQDNNRSKKIVNLVEPQVKPHTVIPQKPTTPISLTPNQSASNSLKLSNGINNNKLPVPQQHSPAVTNNGGQQTNQRRGSFNQLEIDAFNFQQQVTAGTDVIRDVARALMLQGIFSAQPVAVVHLAKPTIDVDIPMYTENQITRNKEIGKGSFGKVWCGVVNGEIVAIKDMVYKSEKEIQMWKKEVKILERLQNDDFLVQIKGYCISDKLLTIVMELMECGSIYEIIHEKRNGPVIWSMLQKVRILRHVSKGIESVHAKNIVHRDLKSMNILIDSKGTAKLADLGCASIASSINTLDVGSPLWMAPEVHSGNYSYPCDIFSYGVVTFEVFNESLPDYNMSQRSVLIPEDCVGYPIIKKCTQHDPALRPTSHGLVEIMDSLILTFVSAVTRVIEQNHKGTQVLPAQNEVERWYQILLNYEKEIFDTLLSTGLNYPAQEGLKPHDKLITTTHGNYT